MLDPVRGGDPVGLHRVLAPPGVLPQAAGRLDTRKELWPDETRVRSISLYLPAGLADLDLDN